MIDSRGTETVARARAFAALWPAPRREERPQPLREPLAWNETPLSPAEVAFGINAGLIAEGGAR